MLRCNFDIVLNEEDFPEYEIVNKVIRGILKILEYQLFSQLNDSWLHSETSISVYLYSSESVKVLKPFNKLPRLNEKLSEGEITVQEQPNSEEKTYYFRKEFDVHQFRDLASAEINVDEGIPFSLLVYDIQKIPAARVQEVRDILLETYYEGLKQVAKIIDVDLLIIEKAYQNTKSKAWFENKPIGEVVCSRGGKPSKAQLIARWEPDYIYHSARIFEQDGTYRDIVFMIYWRLVDGNFFDAPGRLSWVDKNTLKFIPNSRDDYRFVFSIDKGPVDFSYYFEPPRYRATKFYAHLVEDHETSGRNTLYLN